MGAQKGSRHGKKVVFGIQEQQCIWMKAGVVNFKLCQNAYDCVSCSFDKAMQKALREDDVFESWRRSMLKKPTAVRWCRHMMAGDVAVRPCGYAYDCARCEFDQTMDYRRLTAFPKKVELFSVSGFALAADHYYHPGHSWARIEYGGLLRVGMDDFSWRLLGFLDEVRLPEIGTELSLSDRGWSVRREEKVAPMMAPVNGVVVARNYQVMVEPNRVKDDPYGEGWLLMVEPSNSPKAISGLMEGETARTWLRDEVVDLDSLVEEVYEIPLAATGGERPDDIYGNLKRIGWDRLVEKFLIRR